MSDTIHAIALSGLHKAFNSSDTLKTFLDVAFPTLETDLDALERDLLIEFETDNIRDIFLLHKQNIINMKK
jgi:hypothetical protein